MDKLDADPASHRLPAHEVLRRRVASARVMLNAVERFPRARWLLRSRSVGLRPRVRFRTPTQSTAADVEIARRLLAAYEGARSSAPRVEGMWTSEVFQVRQRALQQALDAGSAEQLADLLGSMFRSDIVVGLASGTFGLANSSRGTRWLWAMQVVEPLVSLAESLGAVQAENPEQGEVAPMLDGGLERIVTAIEGRLGTSIDFPDVGAAYGLDAAGRLIPFEWPDQIYAATRISSAISNFMPPCPTPRIVEIGAGYGGMAYWITKLTNASVTIVDLPVVNVLQGYFLAHAFGGENVALYGERAARVTVLPTHALEDIAPAYQLLVNKDSLPEIPERMAREYLEWARGTCAGLLYSCNQEAGATFGAERQNVVPDLVRELGGFDLLRRDRSWVRPGYVEEIYRRNRLS